MKIGGRPRRIETEDIVRAGRDIGLAGLSLNAVAARLGVTAAALYRHVGSRWGLERLVGERVLADLRIEDDPERDTARHLLFFALRLREHVLAHPGLAAYLQTLFPRGESGRRILAAEVVALGRRGYDEHAAVVLTSALASCVIGSAAAEERRREHVDGLDGERDDVVAHVLADDVLGPAHRDLPAFDEERIARLTFTAVIGGLLAVGPPGRPIDDIFAELDAKGAGI